MGYGRWILQTSLGLTLGVALAWTTGCAYREQDDFINDFTDEVCRMVVDCGRELNLPNGNALDPATCDDQVSAFYSSCGDRCAYNRRKAKRCINRLSNNVCEDELNPEAASDENIPIVCDEVFTGCEGSTSCSAPSCSVSASGGDGLPAAAGLMLLCVAACRRRRWRSQ